MGNLESGPHGAVHVWTTDPTIDFNNPKSDMGVLASAAFDPVFFAHHANIDRIWDKWNKANPAQHTNPTSSGWLQQAFFFYDQAPNWTYISKAGRRLVIDDIASLTEMMPSGAGYVIGLTYPLEWRD